VQASASLPVRIGVWGTFDVENFGDTLFPVLARAELGRRLPGAQVRAFAPFGRATRLDRGERAEAERAAEHHYGECGELRRREPRLRVHAAHAAQQVDARRVELVR
jgi:hypothetical protein